MMSDAELIEALGIPEVMAATGRSYSAVYAWAKDRRQHRNGIPPAQRPVVARLAMERGVEGFDLAAFIGIAHGQDAA
jgi:hypothetical protein